MNARIVLDTNVFISALLGPRGASREILRRCLNRRYVPLMGTALFLEYEAVLGRDHLFTNCRLSADERETLLDAVVNASKDQLDFATSIHLAPQSQR